MKKTFFISVLLLCLMAIVGAGASAFNYYEGYTLNTSMVSAFDDFNRATSDVGNGWIETYLNVVDDYQPFYTNGGEMVCNYTSSMGNENKVNFLTQNFSNTILTTEFDILINGGAFLFQAGNRLDNNESTWNMIQINDYLGTTYVAGTENSTNFPMDTNWHHFKIQFDLTTLQTTMWLDGGLVAQYIDPQNPSFDGVINVLTFQTYSDGWTDSYSYLDNFVLYEGTESPYYLPPPPFNISNYANNLSINCVNITAGTPIVVNGSNGFSFNGSQQIVWTICDLADLTLWYNSDSDWAIADPQGNEWYWDTEKGDVASHNASDVWADFMEVYHFDAFYTDIVDYARDSVAPSTHQLWKASGTPTIVSGVFGNEITFPTSSDWLTGGIHNSDDCAQYTYEVWIDPSGTQRSGSDNWAIFHQEFGGCGSLGLMWNYDDAQYDWDFNCQSGFFFVNTTNDLHYVGGTYDGTYYNAYTDGQQSYQEAGDRNSGGGGTTLYVGGGNGGVEGTYDELRISCNAKPLAYFEEVYNNKLGTEGFGTLGAGACVPNWVCSGYGNCLLNGTQPCNNATDQNNCGEEYTGDFSEFEPLQCQWEELCYQESADTQNQTGIDGYCGLDYSGTYFSPTPESWIGFGVVQYDHIFDGDWESYGAGGREWGWARIEINYTIPSGANPNSVWQVKTGSVNPPQNFSIPSECWGSGVALSFRENSYYNTDGRANSLDCWDGVEWLNIYASDYTQDYYRYLYEEAMWWNMSCFSQWSCSEYSGICDNTYESCVAVEDSSQCGVPYGGDYSEFTRRCPIVVPYDQNHSWWNTSWTTRNALYFDSIMVEDFNITFFLNSLRFVCANSNMSDTRLVSLNGEVEVIGKMWGDWGEGWTQYPTELGIGAYIENVPANQTGLWGYVYCNNSDADWIGDVNFNGSDFGDKVNLSTLNMSWYVEQYTPPICQPNWNCSLFDDCVEGNKECLAVEDLNVCGVPFEGLLSDFDEECEMPQTGYIPNFITGDLTSLSVDTLGSGALVVLSMIGLVVMVNVVIYLFNRVKGGIPK